MNNGNILSMKKIAIIGAGNGGQAMAGHLSAQGHIVKLYDRNASTIEQLNNRKIIELEGCLQGVVGQPVLFTTNIGEAVDGAEIIMITTTATAHRDIALALMPYLDDGQYVVLNPGRTAGALEFYQVLKSNGFTKKIHLAEAQTLIYACRIIEHGKVNVIGIKDRVLLAGYPASETNQIIENLKPIYDCFYPAKNVLRTSFENIGAIFHPSVLLFNAASIERGESFYFYRDMTPGLAHIIETLDSERLAVAKAFGIELISAKDWISYAYIGVEGDTLCERMQNNPAYYDILAPTKINCRQITEDIPTGIVPLAEFGDIAGIDTPIMDSLIELCSSLMHIDYKETGRTLRNLGLENLSVEEILKLVDI